MPKRRPVRRRPHKHTTIVQPHHITYDPPWVVDVYKGEHWILTQLQWRKRFSKGFITALEEFIRQNKEKAYELIAPADNPS
jgi:hypothetical protein